MVRRELPGLRSVHGDQRPPRPPARLRRGFWRDWPEIPASRPWWTWRVARGFSCWKCAPGSTSPPHLTDSPPPHDRSSGTSAPGTAVRSEGVLCPAEKTSPSLTHPRHLVLCKHFLPWRRRRPVSSEWRRVPAGGRGHLHSLQPRAPLARVLPLHFWILLTAPAFLRPSFGATMELGWPASRFLCARRAAGFTRAEVLRRHV